MDVQVDHVHITQPSYFYVTDFEKNFNYKDGHKWMKDNYIIPFYCCALYLVLIFGGRYYMSNRPKFELRGLLAIWSGSLAILSIICFVRTLPEVYNILSNHGFYHSICTASTAYDPVNCLWLWLFCLLKVPELGDTFFIVLRKQPLIFLHWYHHVTVLLYTWYSCVEISGYSRWFVVVNSFIHSWMYSYYALKAMGFKLPKWLAMTITTLQIAQMFWGILVTVSAYYYAYIAQVQCNVPVKNLTFTTLMYLSYLILFINFFKQTYFSNKRANKVGRKSRTKTE
ncbi:elongation of very long chain fatty acids protein 6-like [Frieseomelitta varia]|nr:elongation of very long chain fatty acids protein 6-like [Frieseomelitta varia]